MDEFHLLFNECSSRAKRFQEELAQHRSVESDQNYNEACKAKRRDWGVTDSEHIAKSFRSFCTLLILTIKDDQMFYFVTPPGGGQQVIIDVAVTGVDGSLRRIHDNSLQPLMMRFMQKIQKYHHTADQHGYQCIAFVFSQNGQIHPYTVIFVFTQIDHKLRLVHGGGTSARRINLEAMGASYIRDY